jgi:hypothetical protein
MREYRNDAEEVPQNRSRSPIYGNTGRKNRPSSRMRDESVKASIGIAFAQQGTAAKPSRAGTPLACAIGAPSLPGRSRLNHARLAPAVPFVRRRVVIPVRVTGLGRDWGSRSCSGRSDLQAQSDFSTPDTFCSNLVTRERGILSH